MAAARFLASVTLATLLTAAAAPPLAHAGTFERDIVLVHDGIDRYTDLYIPDTLASPAPLVIALHGGTGSNDGASGNPLSGPLLAIADREGFLIAFPNGTDPDTGTSAASGRFNWNDCRVAAGDADTSADDVGFVHAVIAHVASAHAVDRGRVYATGASNGGMMSFRLAHELGDELAAIAAVIANQPDPRDCADPTAAVSVLIMNGTEDPLMPWEGGTAGQGGEVLSTHDSRAYWLAHLGIAAAATTESLPDLDPADGSTVHRERYTGGRDATELELYEVRGGGHVPPSIAEQVRPIVETITGPQNHDIEAAELIWSFFARHSRASTSPPADAGPTPLDAGAVTPDASTPTDASSLTTDARTPADTSAPRADAATSSPGESGGCGACAVSDRGRAAPLFPWLAALAILLARARRLE